MRLCIAGAAKERVIELKLEQIGDTVVVSALIGAPEWNLITFRVVNEKLVFSRNTAVEDDAISTEGDSIVEVSPVDLYNKV